jgi:hypothetical protein
VHDLSSAGTAPGARGLAQPERPRVAQFDPPLAERREYTPALVEPADLDRFWSTTPAEARSYPLAASFAAVENGLTEIASYDVAFAGFGASPVRAGPTSPPTAADPWRPWWSAWVTAGARAGAIDAIVVRS